MGSAAWAATVKAFFDTIGKEGTFALGALFGAALMTLSFWLNSRERQKMLALIIEREKTLQAQLEVKEKRITALHEELSKLRKEGRK